MNVELNAFVVFDDWQAVVNRTVANYFDSLGFEHLDQVLDMRVFDLLNMNLLDAVRVEEIIVYLYRSLNPNITVDEAMYCGAMNQCFDYTGWRKIHRQLEKITVKRCSAPERNGKQSGRMKSIMPRLRAEEKLKEQKIP